MESCTTTARTTIKPTLGMCLKLFCNSLLCPLLRATGGSCLVHCRTHARVRLNCWAHSQESYNEFEEISGIFCSNYFAANGKKCRDKDAKVADMFLAISCGSIKRIPVIGRRAIQLQAVWPWRWRNFHWRQSIGFARHLHRCLQTLEWIGPSWTYYSLQIWNPFLSFLSVLITGDEEAASKYALREALRLWWWHHHLPDGPVLAGCELGIDRALALAPIRNLVNFCALVRQ